MIVIVMMLIVMTMIVMIELVIHMMMMMMNDDMIGITGEPQKKFFCIYNIIHLVVIRGFLYGKIDDGDVCSSSSYE